jgi:hypothetical protein
MKSFKLPRARHFPAILRLQVSRHLLLQTTLPRSEPRIYLTHLHQRERMVHLLQLSQTLQCRIADRCDQRSRTLASRQGHRERCTTSRTERQPHQPRRYTKRSPISQSSATRARKRVGHLARLRPLQQAIHAHLATNSCKQSQRQVLMTLHCTRNLALSRTSGHLIEVSSLCVALRVQSHSLIV